MKAFQYLATANLENQDHKLIFNDMDFNSKKPDPRALYDQAKLAVKKYSSVSNLKS